MIITVIKSEQVHIPYYKSFKFAARRNQDASATENLRKKSKIEIRKAARFNALNVHSNIFSRSTFRTKKKTFHVLQVNMRWARMAGTDIIYNFVDEKYGRMHNSLTTEAVSAHKNNRYHFVVANAIVRTD